MNAKTGLMLTVATFGMLGAVATSAHATPYAYASNQITGLTLTLSGGAPIIPSTANTSISDTAQFDGFPISGTQTTGTVGTASTINQAYAGPGPMPAAIYTPVGAGSFTGARANANIGAGTAANGGVSVRNVAEAYGGALGNSIGTNNAAISFTLTGTGQAVTLTFSDLIQLVTSTVAAQGESANAAIQNNFSITALGATTPLATFAPSEINRQISSVNGIPTTNSVGPTSYSETFTSPVLQVGTLYNIALTTTASETIQPGTRVSTPEPASLAILGGALAALGIARRRRAR